MTNMNPKIIAVDFDGTLCRNEWPEIGEPNTELIEELKKSRANGDKIILWTCRSHESMVKMGDELVKRDLLNEAIMWCYWKHDLSFDAVNENLPEVVARHGSDSRKIFADVYIDDKADRVGYLDSEECWELDMKEVNKCFIDYANSITKLIKYNYSSDAYKPIINDFTSIFVMELKKYIDWQNLREDVCKKLGFCKWMTDEEIGDEIESLKVIKSDDPRLLSLDGKRLTPTEKIAKLENQRNIWLIPLYLLPIIPIGIELVAISGDIITYDGTNIDNECTFSHIPYGIKPKKMMKPRKEPV